MNGKFMLVTLVTPRLAIFSHSKHERSLSAKLFCNSLTIAFLVYLHCRPICLNRSLSILGMFTYLYQPTSFNHNPNPDPKSPIFVEFPNLYHPIGLEILNCLNAIYVGSDIPFRKYGHLKFGPIFARSLPRSRVKLHIYKAQRQSPDADSHRNYIASLNNLTPVPVTRRSLADWKSTCTYRKRYSRRDVNVIVS